MEGYTVVTSDGRKAGRVVDVVGANLVVEQGLLFKRRRPLPSALVHPDGDRLVRAAELAPGFDGCEADLQLELGRASGLVTVCADLVERSVPSPSR